jgi:CRP-like cAMP-binding protein
MRSDIARFTPFSGLNACELDLVARHARRISVPGGRWLLRPGRVLSGHHFLLQGVVATHQPASIISANQAAARTAIYPGARGLRTLAECELLQVPDAVLDLLATSVDDALIVVGESEDCWQTQFLGSELMARLAPAIWQSVLNRLSPCDFSRGERVIREGARATGCCYVLASGIARVERRGRLLALLKPGQLFGEDALITNEPRNASVFMEADGKVMALSADDFRRFLVDVLLAGIYAPPAQPSSGRTRVSLRLASSRDMRERIGRLDRGVEYLVSSRMPDVESLAIFLMRKCGISAWAAPRA